MSNESSEPPFRDNNDNAYSKQELREGAPLDYIAGKIHKSIEITHQLYRNIEKLVPDKLPQPEKVQGTDFSTKNEILLSECHHIFHDQVVAYVALYNMLGVANTTSDGGETLFDRLLRYENSELKNWLNDIARRGMLSEISEMS